MYRVIICSRCGRLLLTKREQKTRQCPNCEARINVELARIMGSATTAREASALIRALKQRGNEENDKDS